MRIGVIGAGAAGLYATQLLLERGHEVVLLEARDQVGGRITPLEGWADVPLEMGAEEIHGADSPWARMLRQAGAELFLPPGQDYIWYANQLWPEDDAPQAVQDALDFVATAVTWAGPPLTVTELPGYTGLQPDTTAIVNARLGNLYGTSDRYLCAAGIAEQELHWKSGPEDLRLRTGSLLDWLKIICHEAVAIARCGRPVIHVKILADGVTLTDATGEHHTADAAICTVPLPVLRQGLITFDPVLPPAHQAAIKMIGMGPGLKVQLRFTDRFWPADMTYLIGGQYIPEFWDATRGRGNTPVLTGFVMGDAAYQLGPHEPTVIRRALEDLDRMFGGIASASCTGAQVQDWSRAPWTGGAYSYPVAGGGLDARRALAGPVGGRLYWAGEATSEGHQATVHGAIETALRAVDQVLRRTTP
ncbi:MAG: NAD(P)/FAD-dependent oxidoreductase [Bacteroidia bacterium]|nr:NAD(P)/FAD-dependent oxidoreductase [Bacteroidia bacterium]